MGTTGKVWAYEAKTGKKIWSSTTGAGSKRLEEAKTYAIANRLFLSGIDAKPYWITANLSSMIVSDGVIVAPADGGALTGLNPDNGTILWEKSGLLRTTATPALCKVNGKEYLLCNNGSDSLRMVDPKTGNALWAMKTGEYLGTVATSGDTFITNVGIGAPGLYGAFRATMTGASLLWKLPEKIEYRHGTKLDAGALHKVFISSGVAYMILQLSELDRQARVCAVNLSNGKFITDSLITDVGWGKTFHFAENRLIICDDQSHTQKGGSLTFHFNLLDPEKGLRYIGKWSTPFSATDGYEVPVHYPFVGGLWFFRTREKTLQCFDFRKGAISGSLATGAARNSRPFASRIASSVGPRGLSLTVAGESGVPRVFDTMGRLLRTGNLGNQDRIGCTRRWQGNQ